MLEANLRAAVRFLSDEIGERSFKNLHSLERAALFIEDGFRSAGLTPERQSFTYEGNTYFNIIATVPGLSADLNPLVLGAHYDTVAGSPGADDNASGVAALLELARLLKDDRPLRPIILAAFSLEEPPVFMESRMGSLVYAQYLKTQNTALEGMISLEMLGYYSGKKGSQFYPVPAFRFLYPEKGDFIALVGDNASKKLTLGFKRIFKSVSDFPVESLNASPLIPGVSFSDHYSFWKMGYRAFMVTDTAFFRNPYYHARGDTFDTLDYQKFAKLVNALYLTLKRI